MPRPSLVCHDLSFTWPDGRVVLDGLDLALPPGRTGLVGTNGSGKSTLLRLLAGQLAPTGGHVERTGRVGLLPQDLVLDPSRSVGAVLGVDRVRGALARLTSGAASPAQLEADLAVVGDDWDAEERALALLAGLGSAIADDEPSVWLDRRTGTLSGGEVVLLGLAAELFARPDVLLLDEPTNNLDAPARARLRAGLAAWHGPVVVVSHDEELLEEMDTTAELREGCVRLFGGGFTAYADTLEVEQEAARRKVRVATAEVSRQQRELVETRTTLEHRQRFGRAAYARKRHPKTKMQQLKRSAQVSGGKLRVEHEDDLARAREQLAAAEERVRDDLVIRVDLPATAVPVGRDVAVLDRVGLRNGLLVSLHLRGPERLALVGPNGSGKTTLLETLAGVMPPRSGTVTVPVPVRVLPQRLRLLDDAEAVLDAVRAYAPRTEPQALRAGLARFRLGADLVHRAVGSLSGGERFRATLAALLLAEPAPQLLLLDEPTNSLDRDSVSALVTALQGYRGALVVASHDQRFLERLGLDRTLDLGR